MIRNFLSSSAFAVVGSVALIASGQSVAARSLSSAQIPADFRGNWYEADGEPPVCSPDDNGLVQVEAREFSYPMSVNSIISVEPLELNVIRVTYQHQGVGDGDTAPRPRTVTERWTLSHDESSLLIESDKGRLANGVADLVRCMPPVS